MVKLSNVIPALFCASFASAQLTITKPNAETWWVAKSQNVLEWSCNSSPYATFTVLVTNTNPGLAVAPLAIIAIQQNTVCSLLVTQDQANQVAGTGWQILFANPLNNTDVYATSQAFEIKPLGSQYPSQVSSSISAAQASASANAPQPTSSGAASPNAKMMGASGVGAVILGLVAGLFA